jgi:hypothetical protein
MLLKANQLMLGDRLILENSTTPKMVTEVSILEGGVKIVLEDNTTEWYPNNKVVIAHRPVQ